MARGKRAPIEVLIDQGTYRPDRQGGRVEIEETLEGMPSKWLSAEESELWPLWYNTLQKPSFNPPNYLFGPVWTCLYILMGISSFLIWRSPKTELRKRALIVYSVQLFLNFWWSIVFFSFHLLLISMIEILALLASIVYMIVLFRTIKPIAA